MSSEAEDQFWQLAEEFLAEGDFEKGTLIGFDCLRVGGEFLAAIERKTDNPIVKLDKSRVAALVESGESFPFAPAKRVFSEWVAIADPSPEVWRVRIREGIEIGRSR